ncbi:MAG TPA: hypothetical protein VH683_10195 [Thermoleophilaceae bacterium]|jgi:predicted lipoprotein with Yx(FWY)xxD motif
MVLVALVVAGCGGHDAPTASAGPNMAGGSGTIGVSDIGGLGKVLVDSNGRTAYLFEKDTGPKSTCSGACASDWPPVTTKGKPTVGEGVTASLLGATKRADGSTQVTYDGHPLYLYAGDSDPGDAAGQGLDFYGAKWFVVSPDGQKVTAAANGSGGGSSYPY